MQVIPAIDMLAGSAVRLVRGDYAAPTVYESDVLVVGRRWMEGGAALIHVVDLDAARGRARDLVGIERLTGEGVPIQLGGGIRTAAQARAALESGARRLVLGSVLTGEPGAARDIVDAAAPAAIVAAIDVRADRALGSGWTDAGIPLREMMGRVLDLGIPRALVTGIDRDGTLDGPDVGLLDRVRLLAPDLSIIASGGVGSLEDIDRLRRSDIGVEAVIVGKALYEDRFTLPEAIALADR